MFCGQRGKNREAFAAAHPAHENVIKSDFRFRGVVEVRVIEAFRIKSADLRNTADPFVSVQYEQDARRTRHIKNRTQHAKWDQKCYFSVSETDGQHLFLFVLWDHDDISTNDNIGEAAVQLASLEVRGPNDVWLHMKKHDKLSGILHVSFSFLTTTQVEQIFWKTFASLVDVNSDGKVTTEELRQLLLICGDRRALEECQELIKQANGSTTECSVEELALMFSENGVGKEISKHWVVNPLTGKHIDDGHSLFSDLVAAVDRHTSQFLESGFVTTAQARAGWFTGLTEWAEVGVSPSTSSANGETKILVQDRSTGLVSEEFIPSVVFFAIKAMYKDHIGHFAIKNKSVLVHMSEKAGHKYTSPDSVKDIPNFIATYKINMAESLHQAQDFKNFNEFFSRELKPDARPIFEKDRDEFAVSAADCRLLGWQQWNDAKRLWIKGKLFSLDSLLKGVPSAPWKDSTLVIFRLAPQDYHRVHCPVSGRIEKIVSVPGALYTVNPIAINSELDVYSNNKRVIVVLESPEFGSVALVVIGATAVGTIGLLVQEGQQVKKGDPLNFFAYGGSTVVALFQKGKIQLDRDILERSQQPLETFIRMGDSLGRAQ
eukprot:c16092_g1_i1.p1 GENE.c16092_g1_i1~~c16092_g1_i1.p1  ORF type:complete len:602 (+),score=139.83 c16092_g1_i1:51-1856(+)